MSRHILIAGGTRGIGLGCAKQFVAQGDRVTVLGYNQEHLKTAQEDVPNLVGYLLDLQVPDQVNQCVEQIEREHGAVDVLVNSAGRPQKAVTTQLTHTNWQQAMQSKFFTTTNMLDAVLPKMAARNKGSVVNVIGYSGKGQIPNQVNTGAANAALMMITTGLAHEYARLGVRINAVNPAGVYTEQIQRYIQQEADWRNLTFDQVLSEMTSKYPRGKLATVEEVAATVLFLASDAAASICGAIIPIEGARNPLV